ncbi:MAG: DUF1254 domain-containing protein [Candidatus Andeanibacterium colombiense]|uniref:DUF1254 domain-containing protein n=1 Tax=Candidatus Andeanibacterium colombiense TaxID=3121345 RepID=A0AAJ5X4E7_9SPHN|nr:MAG: DUF1254 domain-containing protein [Sphingomonadaceae bacterium]
MIEFTPSRRHFLAAAGIAGASALLPASIARAADDLPTLAEDAFIWGVPLVLSGRYIDLAAKAGLDFNRFYLSPDLATPSTHAAGPNIDTLYGFAWLDLAAGPQVIAVPEIENRYYSIQLLDTYGDSFSYIGSRATGTKAGAYAVTAPDWKGSPPVGVTGIAAPTVKVLVLVRTLVSGQADLPAARAVHTAYTTGALSAWPHGRLNGIARTDSINVLPVIDLSGAGAGYFDELDALVKQYPPLPADAANFARFASLGIGTGTPRSAELTAALTAAVPAGLARIQRQAFAGSTVINGWRTNLSVVPFIRDPLARAANNIYGPGGHIAKEALYFLAREGPDGQPLDGSKRYRLRFAKGQTPAVDAFWSLILYDKNFFLFDNPDSRYSFNDRSEGLVYGHDGSLEILIGADRPEGRVNWIPAPRDSFQLITRFYEPRPSVFDGSYKLPPLEIVS